MATTTNFGWVTPDDTSLVKDGAAAIRTLGQSIDTSMMDLEGGTTGQILSKASNTDMDFIWINNDQGDITGVTAGTGISGGGTTGTVTVTNSMATAIDAKGDLIGGTGADTFARLAVGTNGQILTADSAETTGMKWSTPATVSGWTKITSSTFSAQTSVSINNCFTSTYVNYRVLLNFTSSATNSLYLRFRSSGSDNTANSYTGGWQYQFMSNSGATSAVGGLATYLYLQDTVTGNIGHASSIDIFNPQATDRTRILNNAVWTSYFSNGAGYFDNTTSFDGLTIYPTSGTITGTISIYGYGA